MNTDPAVPGMSANAASHHKCQPVQQIKPLRKIILQ